ncbi:FAD-dependent tricarballylate dehydrogenase TcuA [Sphingomonas sp.]|uniref:FAD-dependent tricarballylate dehydrogenase TcuA n=1 Tax=Sphingomonas sp. TaxID=28214 RepID=UPI0025DE26F6|nr:FAD-dependent tricarballylate dehydrogenase TcuA [Sphingomonas sp.]
MIEDVNDIDVLVVGGGNAALVAAVTARQAGASVMLLEHAPIEFRGGNSRHTRNFRCCHQGDLGVLLGTYDEEEYWQDLLRVTGGKTNEHLARMAIQQSTDAYGFMEASGVKFQPALKGTLSLNRTNAFFLGGGKALVNSYYALAERLGVDIRYDAEVIGLSCDDERVRHVDARINGFARRLHPRAVVVASGGFQANLDWLREAWGPAADNFLIRGTPYARGTVLKNLAAQGAETIGDPTQAHAVAIDARSPKFDGGIVSRSDSVPYSIVVNRDARRFYDEGEDIWPKRYAIWGRLVAQQPDQIAFSICDAKAEPKFMPSIFAPVRANTIPELAVALELDPVVLQETIDAFNASVRPGAIDPTSTADGCHTEGLDPPKSHWAARIDTAPYLAYPLRPGITFTYHGLKVSDRAQVLREGNAGFANLWAAGEIMAGNILGQGYTAGVGMTIGTVFGRIAGREAAAYVGS